MMRRKSTRWERRRGRKSGLIENGHMHLLLYMGRQSRIAWLHTKRQYETLAPGFSGGTGAVICAGLRERGWSENRTRLRINAIKTLLTRK